MCSRGLVLQCLEAMSSTDEKTLRFAMDDFLDNFGKDVEIGQASRRKLLQRYARVFSRLQNVRSTKRFPELHAAMATAAGEHSSPDSLSQDQGPNTVYFISHEKYFSSF